MSAAASPNPEDRGMMFHVCAYGAYLHPERDVFINDTSANKHWSGNGRPVPDTSGYAVGVTGRDGGTVRGNIHELGDYAEYARYIRESAVPQAGARVTYRDGRSQDLTGPVYERSRMLLQSQLGYGDVVSISALPASEGDLSQTLFNNRAARLKLPIGAIEEHLERVSERLDEIRGSMAWDEAQENTADELEAEDDWDMEI